MAFGIVSCTADDPEYIEGKLVEYNIGQVPKTQEVPLRRVNRKIVDEGGNTVAGCLAVIYCWRILYVEILWVDEKYRKCGLGTMLLSEVEGIAREENCTLVHLDTFDFQAKDFYEKHGYEVFGVLEDCPENHKRYYLKKKLKQADSDA